METIYDVLRALIHVFGAGDKHDQALEVINKADPDHPAGAEDADAADAAAEGSQPS